MGVKRHILVKLSALFLACLILVPFSAFASAQSVTKETLKDSGDYEKVSALSSEIAEMLREQPKTVDGESFTRQSVPNEQQITEKLGGSVKEYRMSVGALSDQLRNGWVDSALKQSGDYQWCIPVASGSAGLTYAYAVKNGNDFTATLVDAPAESAKAMQFLYSPDEVAQTLAQSGMTNPKEPKMITVPEIKSDFLVVKQGKDTYFLAFTSRPDLTGFENGKLYTQSEFAAKIGALRTSLGSGAQQTAGGPAQAGNGSALWFSAGAALLAAALLWMFVMKRKKAVAK